MSGQMGERKQEAPTPTHPTGQMAGGRRRCRSSAFVQCSGQLSRSVCKRSEQFQSLSSEWPAPDDAFSLIAVVTSLSFLSFSRFTGNVVPSPGLRQSRSSTVSSHERETHGYPNGVAHSHLLSHPPKICARFARAPMS